MNPKDQATIAAYYDSAINSLTKERDRHSVIKTRLGKIVKREMAIIEPGCGAGIISRFMGQLGATVTAIDISPKLIEYARKYSAHKNVQYLVGDVTEQLGHYANFDGIVLIDVFEHIPRQHIPDLMQRIEEWSHDKTWIYLNIPDGRYQDAAHKYIPARLQLVDEGYSIAEILALFENIGYAPTDISIYGIEAICQYNSFILKKRTELDAIYAAYMGGNG